MRNGYKVFDADMHIMENVKFVEYMDPEYRGRGPKLLSNSLEIVDDYGGYVLEGKVLTGISHIYPQDRLKEGAEIIRRSFRSGEPRYAQARADDFGPRSQLQAMETEGIDLAVCYPSSTMLGFPSPTTNGLDPKVSAAVCRGYNDWLADFCKGEPDRLKGVAAIPVHDVEEAVIEARRAAGLGLVAAFIRPNVINSRNLHDSYYDPLYSELEDLDMPLAVHEGTAGGPPGADARFFGNWVMMHMAAHPLEQMLASESIIVGGVLERHPGLRVAFLEAGCSWLVYWLWRLDEELEAWGWHEVPWLKAKPSEYYLKQCFSSMEGDEPGARYYIEMHGDDNLLWASDYPHPDASYPDASSQFLALDSISSETKKKVLWDNPITYYGFQPTLSLP